MIFTLLLGPLGFLVHVALWAVLAVVLYRERFALWAAIVLAFFAELACVVAIVQAAIYVSKGKTWDGSPPTP